MDSVVLAPSFLPKKSPTTWTNQIRSSHRSPREQTVRRGSGETLCHSIPQKSNWGMWNPSIHSQLFSCNLYSSVFVAQTIPSLQLNIHSSFNSIVAKISHCKKSPAQSPIYPVLGHGLHDFIWQQEQKTPCTNLANKEATDFSKFSLYFYNFKLGTYLIM